MDFPQFVYSKDEGFGELDGKLVNSAEELKALGPDWGPLEVEKKEEVEPEVKPAPRRRRIAKSFN